MTNQPSEKIINRIKDSLKSSKEPMTVADAATKSGLSLHETKDALNYLLAEYRGGLAATTEGELLYSFPNGFKKPWVQEERLEKFFKKFKHAALGVLKFVVRAWISIVMVAYVVIFALILLALTFSKSSDRDNGPSFGASLMFHTLFRMVLDSLFWTFHPFSPFRIRHDDYYDRHRIRQKKEPFYVRVNKFFFGPEEKEELEEDLVKLALNEIRAQKGRIGILDVMRVTGLSKEKADPFLARLMVNHDGDVKVSEDGGIYYEFPAMRKSALGDIAYPAAPIWEKREKIPAFTGNTAGSNFLIAGLNGFNLLMSSVAIANSWTIEKFRYIFTVASSDIPAHLLPPPPEGTPLLLGYIPFFFSLSLFLIPVTRALLRPKKIGEINAKNGKRGLIRVILSKLSPKGIKEEDLQKGWEAQAKAKPKPRELTQEIVQLGGEIELDASDTPVYRFRSLEAESAALNKARENVSKSEVRVGEVVFDSAK